MSRTTVTTCCSSSDYCNGPAYTPCVTTPTPDPNAITVANSLSTTSSNYAKNLIAFKSIKLTMIFLVFTISKPS